MTSSGHNARQKGDDFHPFDERSFCQPELDRIDPAETYGKSAHEIVKMGHKKWFDFYTNAEEGGQSTMGMSYANMLSGTAMRQVNNERMAGNENLEENPPFSAKTSTNSTST
ncbi:MAG: hypothetical protein R2688_08145 [Fimbriimonadaceae bacterium]